MSDDKEIWKPIPNTSENYWISSRGALRAREAAFAKRHPAWWKNYPRDGEWIYPHIYKCSGYHAVRLAFDEQPCHTYFIHVLVMLTFLGPRPKDHQIDHIDLDRSNNRLQNLEYVTVGENHRRRWAHYKLEPRKERMGYKRRKFASKAQRDNLYLEVYSISKNDAHAARICMCSYDQFYRWRRNKGLPARSPKGRPRI